MKNNIRSLRKIAFYLVLICFLWFPFQDSLLSLIYRINPSSYIKFLLVLKEFIIFVILILLFLRKLTHNSYSFLYLDLIGIVYIFLCITYLFFGKSEGAAEIARFTTFRSVVLPVLFVLIGSWLNSYNDEIKLLIKIIFFISIISIIFGFIEIHIPTDKFWNGFLDLHGYLTKIKGLQEGIAGGLVKNVPGNFWGSVLERRMAGTFASPLALGYYLIVPILFLTSKFTLDKRTVFLFLLLIMGLFLTETRAAIFGVLIGLFLYSFKYLIKLKQFKLKVNLLPIIIIFFLGLVSLFYEKSWEFLLASARIGEGRAIGHIQALQISMVNIKKTTLIGEGFGLAGGWAALQGSKIVGAGESTYLSIMYQIGGIGLALFFIWWFCIIYKLIKISKYSENTFIKDLSRVFLILNVVYFLTGFISEQIITFTSVAHFWILTGAIVGARRDFNL